MSFKPLIAILVVAVVVGMIGFPIAFKDRDVPPYGLLYQTKLAGEWMDVNFFTFGAPEKQGKHQELAMRRLNEFLKHAERAVPQSVNQGLVRAYEQELARAEFMAEQLALLDWRFLPLIEKQYTVTLSAYESLADLTGQDASAFRSASQRYNEISIKVLLRKHQHTPEMTQRYRSLIGMRLDWLASRQAGFTAQQLERLHLAKKVLAEGRELEWAYDVAVSVGY